MADTDSKPSGLTKDQNELVLKVANAGFDDLINESHTYFTTMQSLFTGKPSVPATPTANDIVSLAGNLNAVIPAGFLLLHNDLTGGEEGKKGSSSSDSGFSLSSFLGPMLAVAGGAVVAAGIVNGLFGGFSSKTENKTQQLVDDLNDRLSADELAQDPEVLAAQKKGFITYLKTYYIQQAASMAVSGTIEAIGEGMGKAVGGFFTSLINKVKGEEETPNKLQECVNVIMDAVNPSDYVGDTEVDEAVRNGIIGYLKTYMVTQTISMASQNVIEGLGTAAGKAVGGFLSAAFGLGNAESSIQKIQDIVDTLITNYSTDLSGDAEVDAAIKSGLVGYISTYFKSQTEAQVLETAAQSSGTAAGTKINSFITSLFGKNNKESTYQHIQDLVDSLIDTYTLEEAQGSQEVQDALKLGVAGYITSYFESQATSMKLDTVSTALGESAGGAIKSFFGSLFGKKESEEQATPIQHISDIVDTLIGDIKYEEVSSWDEVNTALKEGVIGYLKAYFITQAATAVAKDTTSNLASAAGGAINKFFTSLFGKAEEEPSESGIAVLKEVGDKLLGDLKADEILKWEEIEDTRKEAVKSFVLAYFQIQAEAATETTKNNSEVKEGFANKVKSWWSGKNNDSNSNAGVQKLLEIASALDSSLKVDTISKDTSITEARDKSIKGFVTSYYNTLMENTLTLPDISSDIKEKQKTTATSIANSLLDVTVNSLNTEIEENKVTFKMDTSATIKQDENSDKMVTTLDKISSLLDELNTFIQTHKTEEGESSINIVASGNSAREDNLSVNIPG